MKKLLIAFLLFLISGYSPAFAEYREIPDNVWINAPEDYQANLLITGENFKLSFNDTYTVNPIKWDIYSNKHIGNYDNTTIAYFTVIADEASTGIGQAIIANVFSNNPLIDARGITVGGYGENAKGGSFTSTGVNSMPAYFYTADGRGVVVNCNLEVTGVIINPQLEELERRIAELEER